MCLVTFSSSLLPDLKNINKGFSSKSFSVLGLILLFRLPRGAVCTSLTSLKNREKPEREGVPDPKLLIRLRMHRHISLFMSEVFHTRGAVCTSLTGLKNREKPKSEGD